MPGTLPGRSCDAVRRLTHYSQLVTKADGETILLITGPRSDRIVLSAVANGGTATKNSFAGVPADEHPGELEIPCWKPGPSRCLAAPAQRERIGEPEFYEMLQGEIMRRLVSLPPLGAWRSQKARILWTTPLAVCAVAEHLLPGASHLAILLAGPLTGSHTAGGKEQCAPQLYRALRHIDGVNFVGVSRARGITREGVAARMMTWICSRRKG